MRLVIQDDDGNEVGAIENIERFLKPELAKKLLKEIVDIITGFRKRKTKSFKMD